MAELSERTASGSTRSTVDGEVEASELNQSALEFTLGAFRHGERMIATTSNLISGRSLN